MPSRTSTFCLHRPAVVFLLLVGMLVAGTARASEDPREFERGEALIEPRALKALMDRKGSDLVVIAVARPMLEYRVGHIPGAVNAWRPMYEPSVGDPWPYDGMILDRRAFQAFARDLGVNDDSTVVVYDHKYDATRLWWAFHLYGKKDVRVLDGGYPAWVAAGYDVNRIFAEERPRGNFSAEVPRAGWRAELGDVWRARARAEWNVWDTRDEAEWSGETVKGEATCGGRVPWARHLPWEHFKEPLGEDGEVPTAFRSAEAMRGVLDRAGIRRGEHHVFYCQSGVRCTTDLFALYLLGHDPRYLHNYDGSWLEWSYHYCEEEVHPRPIAHGSLIETGAR